MRPRQARFLCRPIHGAPTRAHLACMPLHAHHVAEPQEIAFDFDGETESRSWKAFGRGRYWSSVGFAAGRRLPPAAAGHAAARVGRLTYLAIASAQRIRSAAASG